MKNRLPFNPRPMAFAVAGAMCAGAVSAATGPSTLTEPYLVPVADGVEITTVLTVGDDIGGYRMVGVPDGLGAFDSGDGSITVLMNHELSGTRGIPRAHGALAAFVSQWSINPSTYEINSGADMIAAPGDIYTWQGPDREWDDGTTVFNRLCSADLPALTAFHADGEGYDGLIFMNGEEAADEGRAFAWFATGDAAGEAWELPALGKMAWENAIASPYPQKLTLVMGMDDDGREDSQLYMYIGLKRSAADYPEATPVELAGLHGGELYGLRVVGTRGIQNETRAEAFDGPNGVGNGKFLMLKLGNVTNKTGAQIEDQSEAIRVSAFRRLEDGQWDPDDPRKFYFTTTDDNVSDGGTSRLWRLTFTNIERPEKGGKIELLLDGTEGYDMLDNMTVAPTNGKIYLQEDPGGDPRLAAVWEYDPSTEELKKLAEFDPLLFSEQTPTQPEFLTDNEESSGIIDVTALVDCPEGNVCLLLDAQVHTSAGDDELVEPGQLLLMSVPNS